MKLTTFKSAISIITGCILFLCNSCIKNDIPYARIPAEILSISVRGQLENPEINKDTRTVIFTMADTVDLKKVQIEELELTENASISPELTSTSIIDLSSPKEYILSIYQDYQWTISAIQTIDRRFVVDNMMDTPVFDVENFRAITFVRPGTDLSNINITDLRLGPSNSTISPAPGQIKDFTQGDVTVKVTYRDIEEIWMLYVIEKEDNVSDIKVDAWEKIAWFTGSGVAGGDNGFEYREISATEWTKITQIETNGGVFKAKAGNLQERTTYVARAYSEGSYTSEVTFTTGQTSQLPNNSFENWSQLSNNAWVVYGVGEDMFWDTGNHGSITLNKNVTTYDETTKISGNRSIKLESQFVNYLGIGRFAAGNLFAGEYLETDGTNGVLAFGRPFNTHPTKLSFWYKCQVTPVTHTSKDDVQKGDIDQPHIFVAVGDWDEPVEIRTKSSERKVFNPQDSHVIAFGELIVNQTVNDWTNYTIELDYRATDRTPKYLVIVATASRWGEYFTGSTSNILWLDDMILEYD